MVESRLKQASSFGADVTINADSADWEKKVFDYVGKNGADIVVTAAPSVGAIESGMKIVKNDGKLLIFGGLPHGSMWNMDPNLVHYNEVTITGSIDATIDDFRRAAEMAPAFDLKRFITHSIPIEKTVAGMGVMKRKEGLKVILEIA
jgi:L-iditol 2-dehydrogenase